MTSQTNNTSVNAPVATPKKYSIATRMFHHSSVIFIVALWALVEFEDSIAGAIGIHKAIGAIFLFWVIARLINLVVRKKVPYTKPMPTWQTAIAHLVHMGLYVCMLAMPIVGILMSVYGGRAVDIFGIIQIPVFVSPDRDMARFFGNLHTDVLFPLLGVLVVAHVLGALYHQFVQKDGLLSRMF